MSASTLPAARTSREWTQTMSLFPAGCPGPGAIRARPGLGVVGTGMIDLHADGSLGAVHRMPVGRRAVRWAALFSSPFFHSTVVVDRAVARGARAPLRHLVRRERGLRPLDAAPVADGDNVADALVLYRQHDARHRTRRRSCSSNVGGVWACGRSRRMAPELSSDDAELAWRAGGGWPVADGARAEAADALRELVAAFEARHGGAEARRAAAWALVRWAGGGRIERVLSRVRPSRSIPCCRARSRRRTLRAPFGAGRAGGRGAAPARASRTNPSA